MSSLYLLLRFLAIALLLDNVFMQIEFLLIVIALSIRTLNDTPFVASNAYRAHGFANSRGEVLGDYQFIAVVRISASSLRRGSYNVIAGYVCFMCREAGQRNLLRLDINDTFIVMTIIIDLSFIFIHNFVFFCQYDRRDAF